MLNFRIHRFRSYTLALACGLSLLAIAGCDLAQNTLKADRSGGMEIQDYRDAMAPRTPEADDGSEAAAGNTIPSLQPYMAEVPENIKPMPLVSISVNQSVPLKDALYELAEQAEYDIELDPNIRGAVIFTARDRPFDEVIARLSEVAGLRYKFDNDVLRVEVDEPYNKTYKIDYLNYVRSNTGTIRNDITVVSGDGADTGSGFEATSESVADFWAELEASVGQILGNAANRSMRTTRDPRITAAAKNPEVVPVAATNAQGQTGAGGENVTVAPPEVNLNVESLPIDEEEETTNRRGGSRNAQEGNGFSFAVNKQAGLITAFATERAHKELQEYLTTLRRSVTAQVLIEAKILEVTLRDEYSAGIDWQAIDLLSGEGILRFDSVSRGQTTTTSLARPDLISDAILTPNGGSNLVVGMLGNDLQAVFQAIQGFGVVKALASPRLTVLNNQSAVMNVSTNVVYFEIDIDRTEGTDGEGDTIDIDSEIRNVPEGVLVNVIPSIDLDRNQVSLALRPTITRIVNQASDPAVQFIAQDTGIESLIPELNVQEIDSVIKVNSGQPVILGGLLQDRVQSGDEGVPVLSEVPMVGNLFKKHQDQISKTELVILLKATIVEPEETVHATDKDLYRTFSGDRRPFKF